MGILVQMGMLYVLTSCARLHYLVATGLAVEAAVLHNFFWHERWTWADRVQMHGGFLRRLISFHLANGAVSLAGNLILMRYFVGTLGLNSLFANGLAIALCSILNFLAGDCIVFRDFKNNSKKRNMRFWEKTTGTVLQVFLFVASFSLAGLSRAQAAELQPETLKAWTSAAQNTERRISAELASGRGFLALDYQDPTTAAKERNELFSGEIPVKQVPAGKTGSQIEVPNGMIHHWRGSILIPGVTLDFVLSRVKNPRPEDTKQEDVLESRVLESYPGQLKLFLKLQRKKIVTVVYNTEHLVRYQRYDTTQASSSSVATKIAEIENYRESNEHEKPEGHDHGYLWRMNSYWRYQQVKEGVIVECESITLSRSIPSLLELMIRPLINSVARESMRRTLDSMRSRMIRDFRKESV
jgi:putative flippase GtrA